MSAPEITDLGDGAVLVAVDGRREVVYVAGPASDRWAFWKGHVYRADLTGSPSSSRGPRRAAGAQSLTAPMPATVANVLVQPGDRVKKGDTVVLLEAMKMELPIRAPGDGTITKVHCAAGEMVKADAVLIDME